MPKDEPALIIVESPAKARTISRFVGRRYQVKASMGHVRDLPKSEFGVDVENGFAPRYVTIRAKAKVVKELKDAARGAGRVLLATDPDREGEAISWHLAQLLGVDLREPCRIVFHEVTEQALKEALAEPRPIDGRLVDAQQARRVLDRVVGYQLSPLLWRKVRRGLSAGRVQSVAVRLIVDRQAEIDAFKKEEYWTVEARLCRPGGPEFEAQYWGTGGKKAELPDEARARALVEDASRQSFAVRGVERKERLRHPPPPFITSTLQQEASRRLGQSGRRIMAVAQQLYEGLDLGPGGRSGLVTYIRTDSPRVADVALGPTAGYIKKRYGAALSQPRRWTSTKPRAGVQGAHECIRPTAVERDPESVRPFLTPDQYRLYRLVWDRFVASQMKAAVLDTMAVDIAAGPHDFRATGSRVKFPGFTVLYTETREEGEAGEAKTLPELQPGDALELLGLEPNQHWTQPPPHYTEAMLVKALEEQGIGRPSTYAPIIETIQQRGYVIKEEKRFHPTPLGKVVVDLLKEHFADIVDVRFTAQMEDRLDSVEEGRADWRQLVGEFYGPFSRLLSRAESQVERRKVPEEETDEVCPECGQRKLVIRHGRFGRFLACPGYPECKYSRSFARPTGAKCPQCGQGEIVERMSRKRRKFWGCNRYPECRYVSWQRPTPRSCPECGAFLVRKRFGKGFRFFCSRPGCPQAAPASAGGGAAGEAGEAAPARGAGEAPSGAAAPAARTTPGGAKPSRRAAPSGGAAAKKSRRPAASRAGAAPGAAGASKPSRPAGKRAATGGTRSTGGSAGKRAAGSARRSAPAATGAAKAPARAASRAAKVSAPAAGRAAKAPSRAASQGAKVSAPAATGAAKAPARSAGRTKRARPKSPREGT